MEVNNEVEKITVEDTGEGIFEGLQSIRQRDWNSIAKSKTQEEEGNKVGTSRGRTKFGKDYKYGRSK